MNIEQYRTMIAQDEEGTPEVVEQPKIIEEVVEEEEKEETTIEVNGEQISIDELRNGYLRQSDYTKKTQKLASEKREIDDALNLYEQVKNNPQMADELRRNVNLPRSADPEQSHVMKLEEQLYDMKLENEINLMISKYDDFEVKDVLQFASEKKMTNLEDAYMLLNAKKGTSQNSKEVPMDIETMKSELKAELMAEMKGKNTGSIISSKQSSNVGAEKEISITSKESKIANAMGMKDKEYARWRDANK